MITLAEVDVLISIFYTLFVLGMLGAFTGAVFIKEHRKKLAFLSGSMAVLLLITMVVALAMPYIFPA